MGVERAPRITQATDVNFRIYFFTCKEKIETEMKAFWKKLLACLLRLFWDFLLRSSNLDSFVGLYFSKF